MRDQRSRIRRSRYSFDELPLSPRQLEVLMLYASGESMHDIAEALNITHRTAEQHKYMGFAKLGVTAAPQIAVALVRDGYCSLDELDGRKKRPQYERASALHG